MLTKFVHRQQIGDTLINFEVFRIYKELHGNVFIPRQYVIKKKDKVWPQHLHGFKLGRYGRHVRKGMALNQYGSEAMAELKSLGLQPFNDTKPDINALQMYKSFHGHLRISNNYEIGDDGIEDWPDHLRGIQLGLFAQYLRKCIKVNQNAPIYAAELAAMGFTSSFTAKKFAAFKAVHEKIPELHKQIISSAQLASKSQRKEYMAQVYRMHSDGMYGESVIENLKSLGLTQSISWERQQAIQLAVRTYIDKNVKNYIYSKFEINRQDSDFPAETWGLKLGSILAHIRRGSSEFKENLQQEGLCFYWSEHRFEFGYAILEAYKRAHKGRVKVPKSFVVPENDPSYPPNSAGFPLGTWLQAVKYNEHFAKYKQKFLDLEVNYDESEANIQLLFNTLKVYRDIFGHVKVPNLYVVPENDNRFEKAAWGMALGSTMRSVRYGTHLKYEQQFRDLGVKYGAQSWSLEQQQVLDAVMVYKKIYGNLNVHRKYVIRINDQRFAPEVRGVKLGSRLYDIFRNNNEPELQHKLKELGVKYTKYNRTTFANIYSALLAYKSIHHHVKVPVSFVVPSNTSTYPQELWGMSLGKTVVRIRRGDFREHKEELQSIGVDLKY